MAHIQFVNDVEIQIEQIRL